MLGTQTPDRRLLRRPSAFRREPDTIVPCRPPAIPVHPRHPSQPSTFPVVQTSLWLTGPKGSHVDLSPAGLVRGVSDPVAVGRERAERFITFRAQEWKWLAVSSQRQHPQIGLGFLVHGLIQQGNVRHVTNSEESYSRLTSAGSPRPSHCSRASDMATLAKARCACLTPVGPCSCAAGAAAVCSRSLQGNAGGDAIVAVRGGHGNGQGRLDRRLDRSLEPTDSCEWMEYW